MKLAAFFLASLIVIGNAEANDFYWIDRGCWYFYASSDGMWRYYEVDSYHCGYFNKEYAPRPEVARKSKTVDPAAASYREDEPYPPYSDSTERVEVYVNTQVAIEPEPTRARGGYFIKQNQDGSWSKELQ